MIGRRAFVRMMAAVPAAVAAPTEALKLTGITKTVGLGSIAHGVGTMASSPGLGEGSSVHPDVVATYLLNNGLPSFVKEALRRERRVPHGLDPDLVANRSFSLAAKVALQRERDFDRAVADTMAQQRIGIARRALGKVLGQEFYW